jgi:meso-butanediol dehydrogenase/(S,S)-butanediol dehydrogenase/diacetyl reductase
MTSAGSVTFDFTSKTVVVTGGTSGIGLQTAIDFADAGANVVIAGRDAERIRTALEQLPESRVIGVETDVADPAQVHNLIAETIDRFGSLDVVVSNAALYISGEITDVSTADWEALRATNIDGLFHLAKAALPELEKTSGTFLVTSSVSGLRGDWGAAIYNASKGAGALFVQSLALDWGPRGVRVNAVAPSVTNTPIVEGITTNPKLKAHVEERIALGRIAEPNDISPVLMFLASDAARYINGVILPVDGGTSASTGQAR